MQIDADGVVADVRYIASPNCDERPPDSLIELLVIHTISVPPGVFGGPHIVELFLNRLDPLGHPYFATIADFRVSAHFLIERGGALVQFVPCSQRAWHAGVSTWRGRSRCNDFSIGIELEGADDVAPTDAQYEKLARLSVALRAHYPIQDIAGHADIAPGRKTDPGPAFDWVRLRSLLT